MGAMSGAMEWHAWLSSARLDPALVHEYALVLARNELEAGDAAYFDHDFLRSMGIDVAKHRLEILKLARPGPGPGERGRRSISSSAASLSGLVAAVGRVARYVRALVRLRGEESSSTALVLVPSQQQQPDSHVDVGRSSFGHCKAPKRTRSMPKAPGTCARSSAARATRPAGGCRAAATVHAMRDAESGGGGDETVQWERLFQDLNPN